MTQQEKDRFECLKLAVGCFANRQGVKVEAVADSVTEAARAFYDFVTNDEDAADD